MSQMQKPSRGKLKKEAISPQPVVKIDSFAKRISPIKKERDISEIYSYQFQ